ncbi:MAG: P-loop NTPase fold protein, partial [Pseudomonadota bacterium]
MSSSNQHVIEFLKYYCSLSFPQYAILIKGEWGCGKTWFIK